METELSPESECRTCGYPIDTATGVTGNIPSPGDLSVCIACGTPEIFIMCPTGMITRSCTEDELREVMLNPVISKMIDGVNSLKVKDPDWPKGPKA